MEMTSTALGRTIRKRMSFRETQRQNLQTLGNANKLGAETKKNMTRHDRWAQWRTREHERLNARQDTQIHGYDEGEGGCMACWGTQ